MQSFAAIHWMCSMTIALIASNGGYADDSHIVLYNEINNCKPNEYFDVNYFLCRLCDPQLNLVPSENGQSCICHPNSVSAVVYDSSVRLPICRRHNCTTNTTNCTSNSIQSPAHCPIYHLHETISPVHTSKYIQIIANETTPKNDLSAKCDQTVAECANPKEYSRFDDYCIPQNLLKDYQSYRQFRMSMPFIIDIYANLDVLVFLCQTVRPSIYCEYIANLCVLSNYAMEKNSPCNVFFATQTTLYTSNGFDGTQTKLVPFLFYPKGRNTIDDVDKVIDQRYKYKRNGEDYDAEGLDAIGYYSQTNKISLVLVGHSLTGELQTIEPLRLTELNLCAAKTATANPNIHFGENIVDTCTLDLFGLLELGEQRPWFLNVYLNYSENGIHLMKAVPVLIRNAFSQNMNPYDRERWQLVKRFYLVDVYSAQNKSYQSGRLPHESIEQRTQKYFIVRYVQRIEFRFQVGVGNRITVPLLIVEYNDIDMHEYRTNPLYRIDFEFSVQFIRPYSLNTFFHIILMIGLIVGVGMAAFETYSYKCRKQQIDYDSAMLLKFAIFLCSSMANVLFALAAILNLYIYYVFESQGTVKALPPFEQLSMIKLFYLFALFLKAVKFAYVLLQQINCDIFFIDWERPRVFEHQITLKPTNNLDTPSICSSARQYQQNEGLSAWRTYFIANEWIKLATKRKCSMIVQILLVLLTLILIHFDRLHLFTFKALFHWPWTSVADRAQRNGESLEMLATGLIVYTSCYIVQRIFNFLCYERYMCNAIQQFVDVCSMSNISVFIFAIDAYGYYIHGRSPHGFADTDMCSMLQQLRRESENMCGHRGLLPNSEHQTFCFLAPLQLHTFYNKLKATLQKPLHRPNGPQKCHANDIEVNGNYFEQNLQQIAHANTTINRFLSAFIDHGLKDLEYIIQEKTIVENILDFEFDTNVNESRGTFFLDNGHSFDNVLFYGNEMLLFMLELLLFICIIVICGNFLFAILFVGIVYEILKHTVHHMAKRNLSKQTLIDERFLM